MGSRPLRVRREPPPFRRLRVRRVEPRSPRLVGVTMAGDELDGFALDQPAASVRVLLPSPGEQGLVVPAWNGNEFLLPDGRRPAIRTFTPRRFDPERRELDLEVVLHGAGVASSWAELAEPGDEAALPAIGQLLEVLPPDRPVDVHLEVASPDARLPLPRHPQATVEWHDLPGGAPPGEALVAAVRAAHLAEGAAVWVAGEAAAVQRIRRHLFDERGLARSATVVRGYWKHGRAGDAGDEA